MFFFETTKFYDKKNAKKEHFAIQIVQKPLFCHCETTKK